MILVTRLSATDSTSPSPSPAFSATSYLFFSQPEIQQNLVGSSNSINLRVRVTASHGLLLWAGSVTKDYIMIGVKNGLVEVHTYLISLPEPMSNFSQKLFHICLLKRVRLQKIKKQSFT